MSFQKYLKEQLQSHEDKIPIVLFLLDNGTTKKGNGWTKEGVGIFDENGNQYPAGWDNEGNAYVAELDTDNTIIGNNGNKIKGFKFENGKIIKTKAL